MMNTQEMYKGQSLFSRSGQFGCVQTWPRTRSLLFTALWSLLVLLALPGASFAQSALADDADTKGSNPNLDLSSTSNVYLRFKLTSTLPTWVFHECVVNNAAQLQDWATKL